MSVGVGYKQSDNELFFSIPKGKLPFIGVIHFDLDRYILKSELLSEYEGKELFISFVRDKVNIRVQMSSRDIVQFHSQLTYNRTEFLVWLDTVKDSEGLTFGHLQKKDGKPEMILDPKTGRQFYFTIKNLFVLDLKDKVSVRVIR